MCVGGGGWSHSPHEAHKQADRQEEADPHCPEITEDARADAIVEDAERGHGGREEQLGGQDAVHLTDEPFFMYNLIITQQQ